MYLAAGPHHPEFEILMDQHLRNFSSVAIIC